MEVTTSPRLEQATPDPPPQPPSHRERAAGRLFPVTCQEILTGRRREGGCGSRGVWGAAAPLPGGCGSKAIGGPTDCVCMLADRLRRITDTKKQHPTPPPTPEISRKLLVFAVGVKTAGSQV
jgi:hypothetical protein